MTNNQWNNVCIADKNGKHFHTLASPMSTQPEIRNLRRHLEQANKYPAQYKFIDLATAHIEVNGQPLHEEMTDDDLELLNKLSA